MRLPPSLSASVPGPWGLFIALLSLAGLAHAAVPSLAGGYNGTQRAYGMAMILEQDEDRIYGRIVDGQSNVFQINGQVNGNTVQGKLYNRASSANFQLELKPTGLKFVIIPIVGGQPDLSAMKQLSFERGRVTHPALADYRVPPPRAGEGVDILPFLENYRGWSKQEVATAYGSIPERDRARIGEFDHLQADLMNRMCRAKASAADLAAISNRQTLDCAHLVALVDRVDEAGTLHRFYDEAEVQRGALYTRIACDRGTYSASRCTAGATAAPAWQDASRILTALLGANRTASGYVMSAPPPLPRLASPPTIAPPPVGATKAKPRERPGLAALEQSKKAKVSEAELARISQTTPPPVAFPELDLTLRKR